MRWVEEASRAAFVAQARQVARPSALQRRVPAAVELAYGAESVVAEHVLPEGLSVDVAVWLPCGRRLAVEVDVGLGRIVAVHYCSSTLYWNR
jgi:hypothetical protein